MAAWGKSTSPPSVQRSVNMNIAATLPFRLPQPTLGIAASAPQEPTTRGAPIFRYSSGSSDVLHALLEYRVTPFRVLVEHSKGALQIKNEIQSLPGERTQGCAL